MKRFMCGVALAAGFLVVLGPLGAQPQKQDPTRGQEEKGPLSAQQFIQQAASGNQFEIQASQLALERAQANEVKEFARMMVADHQKAHEKLKEVAKQQNIQVPERMTEQHTQWLEQLRRAQGEQFDRTYGQIQARAHREALQLLERYSKTGEGELKQYATQILPAIKKHMEQLGTLPGAKEAAVPPGGLRPGQRPNN